MLTVIIRVAAIARVKPKVEPPGNQIDHFDPLAAWFCRVHRGSYMIQLVRSEFMLTHGWYHETYHDASGRNCLLFEEIGKEKQH